MFSCLTFWGPGIHGNRKGICGTNVPRSANMTMKIGMWPHMESNLSSTDPQKHEHRKNLQTHDHHMWHILYVARSQHMKNMWRFGRFIFMYFQVFMFCFFCFLVFFMFQHPRISRLIHVCCICLHSFTSLSIVWHFLVNYLICLLFNSIDLLCNGINRLSMQLFC